MIKQIQDNIYKARELISPYIHETPVDFSSTFSRTTQAQVYLKLENLQKTGSFKVRGAFNKILNIKEEEKKKRSNSSFGWEPRTGSSICSHVAWNKVGYCNARNGANFQV